MQAQFNTGRRSPPGCLRWTASGSQLGRLSKGREERGLCLDEGEGVKPRPGSLGVLGCLNYGPLSPPPWSWSQPAVGLGSCGSSGICVLVTLLTLGCPGHTSDTWLTSLSAGGGWRITWGGEFLHSPLLKLVLRGPAAWEADLGGLHVTRGKRIDALGCVTLVKQTPWKSLCIYWYSQKSSLDSVLSDRNRMWASDVTLNFLVATFLKGKKGTSEINFNVILLLSQYIQNINLSILIKWNY